MKLLKVLKNTKVKYPPIWIMRQAGRYLPEFRRLKKKSNGFMNMVYTPEIASEITLQPIKRFKFDAAIIFSDILIIPDSIGQTLTYNDNKGPALKNFSIDEMIKEFSVGKEKEKLNLVYEAIRKTKKQLDRNTNLIGFVGAPLTLAFFMFDPKRKKKYDQTLLYFKKNKQKIKKIFNLLETAIAKHAINQLKAGAEIIQIFDTWAGLAKGKDLKLFSIDPIKRICKKIKEKQKKKPIIIFPRNVSPNYCKYISNNVDCISVGEDIKKREVKEIQRRSIIQGNLSPKTLYNGGKKLEKETMKILKNFSNKPFIFNLSHGIMPGTPVENVQKLINIIRNKSNEI